MVYGAGLLQTPWARPGAPRAVLTCAGVCSAWPRREQLLFCRGSRHCYEGWSAEGRARSWIRRADVLGGCGLPSGVASTSQVKKLGTDALPETVPRLAPKSHTNCYTPVWAGDGHALGRVATKNRSLWSPGKCRNASVGLCNSSNAECGGYDTLTRVQEWTRPIRRVLMRCFVFKQDCPNAAWAVWLSQLDQLSRVAYYRSLREVGRDCVGRGAKRWQRDLGLA